MLEQVNFLKIRLKATLKWASQNLTLLTANGGIKRLGEKNVR